MLPVIIHEICGSHLTIIFWSYESFPSLGFAGTMPTGILFLLKHKPCDKLFAILIELDGLLIFKVVNYVQKSPFSFYTATGKACRAFQRAFKDASSTVLILLLRTTGFTLLNLILQSEESKHRD